MKCTSCGREYPTKYEGQRCSSQLVEKPHVMSGALLLAFGATVYVPVEDVIIVCNGIITDEKKENSHQSAI